MSLLLEVIDLRKSFGEHEAVKGISFNVSRGEVFGLLGPNGAGKSTTMMMISGLLRSSGGTVKINGVPLDHTNRELRRTLGIVPQDLAIYPDLTARENLSFFGRLYKVRGADLEKKTAEVLERVGLTDRADDCVDEYSGGMKRRLNFAIALLHDPQLLILDEPTVGVDPQSRTHLLNCVRDLQADGMATIYASHYMEEVEAICQRVAIVERGEILACDTLEFLLGRTTGALQMLVKGSDTAISSFAKQLPENTDFAINSSTQATITRRRAGDLEQQISETLNVLKQHEIELVSVSTDDANLERLFLDLTGKGLRD